MNGGADLGGMMGFGPVAPHADEPLFHADWEKRVLGMVVALGACGQWNLDQSRSARESLPPVDYLSLSYYEIWLRAATRLMLDRAMVTQAELDAGHMQTPPLPVKACLRAGDVAAALAKGGPVDRPAQGPARFGVGDRVKTINEHPDSHTRLPRYARGKPGRITAIHGVHVFPDHNARALGEAPCWLYQVTFEAPDLWGSRARKGDTVALDLWQPYLQAAQ